MTEHEILSHFQKVKKNGKGWVALCPAHEDRNPSLSITETDGKWLLHCHAGCEYAAVVDAAGLREAFTVTSKTGPQIVAEYDYVDEAGKQMYQVVRYAPKDFRQRRRVNGEWVWSLGETRRVPYRLPEIIAAVAAGSTVYVVEGEKDVEALRAVGAVATCNAGGAGKWCDQFSATLAGATVIVIADKDEPGRKHAAAVAASVRSHAASVAVVEAAEGKDAADHLRAGKTLQEFVPVAEKPAQPEPVPLSPPSIATSPDILADFTIVLHSRGVVGEDRFAKVAYLCLTSRVLGRPVSLAAKGPSSAGKSFTVQEVIEFFPASAYYALSSMSEHALAYSQEPLSHRFLILYEAAGLESEFASYLLRSLLSEGCIRYETVEKKKGEGMVPRLIEREGPTGLIVTTTQVSLHPENETRLLSVSANDTSEQTGAIMRMLACEDGRADASDLVEWRTLQTWIAAQDNRVAIPFALDLAELVPPVAVRLRRDFATVLNIVKANAVLHQETRDRDTAGRIVATIGDYGTVRELIADLVADEVGATVPETVIETVSAVAELADAHKTGVTYLQLGERLKLDKSAASRRAKVAMNRGYLKNLEDKRGRPARLVVGEPLPSAVVILPTVETLRLHGCTLAEGR